MMRLGILGVPIRCFKVPRNRAVSSFNSIYSTKSPLRTSSTITTQVNPPNQALTRKSTDSADLFKELVSTTSAKRYRDIVPILSEYKKKKLVLDNSHLLSLMSLILNVKDTNLKGVAYEVFLLYNSEILSDIKGYPKELLEMLLDVVYFYKDNTNFDLLLSQYLNSSELNENVLIGALKLYIDDFNIELAKQLLYQVVTYSSQTGGKLSPKILEVYLRRLLQNRASHHSLEFGYSLWSQLGLPITSAINDLILLSLIESDKSHKLSNFISKLEKEDPRVIELNDFLKKSSSSSFEEAKLTIGELYQHFEDDRRFFFFKVVNHLNDPEILSQYVFPLIVESQEKFSDLALVICHKLALHSGLDSMLSFLDTNIIPLGIFDYRFMKMICESYVYTYPDSGSQITAVYTTFLELNNDSKLVYWLSRLLDIQAHQKREKYTLVSSSRSKVISIIERIDHQSVSLRDKVQQLFNNLSRLGLKSHQYIHKFLLTKYNNPDFIDPDDIKYVEELLPQLADDEQSKYTELAIVKKKVQLQFHERYEGRLELQKSLLLEYMLKHLEQLDIKILTDICSVYIGIKCFDLSKKVLEQVNQLLVHERKNWSFELSTYNHLLISRLEFKQAILSKNYQEIIELVLRFKNRDDKPLRKFFMQLLKRDIKYLEKHRSRLQSVEKKGIHEIKEVIVVEKLCIYLNEFIGDLNKEHKEDTKEMIESFNLVLRKYKNHCK